MSTESPGVYSATEGESDEIQDLYRLFLLEKAPALIGPNHTSIPIPTSIYDILVKVIAYMKQGKGVSVVPVMQELTTQQAANILGVSRPFLVSLLNRNEISFHKAGTHRRIYLRDLLAYQTARDVKRKSILDGMAKESLARGEYDQPYILNEGDA